MKMLGQKEPSLGKAAARIERSRALQREKELSEKRAELLEEIDQQFGLSPVVEEELQRRRRERYSARDVRGLLKEMSSSDTPLGTVALLQEKQRVQKMPYIVLSGSSMSMNMNAITK